MAIDSAAYKDRALRGYPEAPAQSELVQGAFHLEGCLAAGLFRDACKELFHILDTYGIEELFEVMAACGEKGHLLGFFCEIVPVGFRIHEAAKFACIRGGNDDHPSLSVAVLVDEFGARLQFGVRLGYCS